MKIKGKKYKPYAIEYREIRIPKEDRGCRTMGMEVEIRMKKAGQEEKEEPESAGVPYFSLTLEEQEAVGQALKKRFFASLGYVPAE